MKKLLVGVVLAGSMIAWLATVGSADPIQPDDAGQGEPRDARFGDGPLGQILSTATEQAAGSPCALTANQLAALMLAPVWAETVSNTLTTPPSPMTLSRYDHGAESIYPFNDPSLFDGFITSPFWHPGIGLWQMDSAGLGASLTAAERIDVASAAGVVASQIVTTYCLAGFDLAWADWFACQAFDCFATYAHIYDAATDQLQNLTTAEMSRLGGMEYRQCQLAGVVATCGFVDPAKAQGNASFTVPNFGPAPLTTAFYVVRTATTEVRIWLNADSGVGFDIQASRSLGTNARNGLAWAEATAFCDLTTVRGVCVTQPTPASTPTPTATPTLVAVAQQCAGRNVTLSASGVAGEVIVGTAGNDVILGSGGDDVIYGGDGDDAICGLGGNDTIIGGPGDDVLLGDAGQDAIWGQGGGDFLFGGSGDDRVRGGDDADRIAGGDGSDDLSGGRGDDTVLGDAGDDRAVRGGTGDDYVHGGDGNDMIVSGNGGSDEVRGGAGDDALVAGGPRPDQVFGGSGNDRVKGLGGADVVWGEAGDDELFGGRQRDLLDGGPGVDLCNGGAQDDQAAACETLTAVP